MTLNDTLLNQLREQLKESAQALGFDAVGITLPSVEEERSNLQRWLDAGYHGEMSYLSREPEKRLNAANLVPGTLRVISLRFNYLPPNTDCIRILNDPQKAYISRYTLGRDYHKVIRKRLKALAEAIEQQSETTLGYRAFVDSAPVMERQLARKAGLGWIGKHSLLLNRQAGSWFFLAELLVDIPLPTDEAYEQQHCGQCTACIDLCPTSAIIAPYLVDARRCISYLTIEQKGAIPETLRPLIGNRIFGCDDCQLCCPWNRFSQHSSEPDFQPRHQLDNQDLISLFQWDEETFLKLTEGSAIRRTGYEGWLRNIAVALGNSGGGESVIKALGERLGKHSPLVDEHITWAIQQLSSQ